MIWKIWLNGNHISYFIIKKKLWKTPFGTTSSDTKKEYFWKCILLQIEKKMVPDSVIDNNIRESLL